MDIYHKHTDTKRCLLFTYCHLRHSKRSIPCCFYEENVTENNIEKLKNLENLNFNLSRYHYPDSLINQRLQTAPSVTRKDLQKPKESSNENERLGYNL